MLVWDALVLLAAVLDSLRLPLAEQITIERSWSNVPSLESETEIQLAVDQSAETILECYLVGELPDALVATPATYSLRAFPRVRATLRYKFKPRERGDVHAGQVYAPARQCRLDFAGCCLHVQDDLVGVVSLARSKRRRYGFRNEAGRSDSELKWTRRYIGKGESATAV